MEVQEFRSWRVQDREEHTYWDAPEVYFAMSPFMHADKINEPILLIHGDEDDKVPIATSEQLAETRPDIVTFLPVRGAPHTSSWNVDPALYEQAVSDFLANLPN